MTDNLSPAEAIQDAQRRFTQADGRWPAIRALVDPLFAARQENHFAERLRAAIAPKEKRA